MGILQTTTPTIPHRVASDLRRQLVCLQQVKMRIHLTSDRSQHYRSCMLKLTRAAQFLDHGVSCGAMRLCGLGHQPPLRVITRHAVLGDSTEGSDYGSRCLIVGSAHLVLRSPALYANKIAIMATAAIPVDATKKYLSCG